MQQAFTFIRSFLHIFNIIHSFIKVIHVKLSVLKILKYILDSSATNKINVYI